MRTHCHKGHPLSGDNLYVIPGSKKRQCIACRAVRRRNAETMRKNNVRAKAYYAASQTRRDDGWRPRIMREWPVSGFDVWPL